LSDATSTRVTGHAVRRLVLQHSFAAQTGHIGCSLSVADLVATLYRAVLRPGTSGPPGVPGAPDDPERDRFVLSKGHAALAVYAALALRGTLAEGSLDAFLRDGSQLGVHPERGVPGIDFSTGSLGMGLAYAAGAALAARLDASTRRTYALLSDAECDAGATWEAALFAGHQRLDALVALVDVNGQQALGATRHVLDLEPLADKWRAFRWRVHEVDGHDETALERVLLGPCREPGAPHVVLARTTFGRGVAFMEGQLRWHYLPLSADDLARALDGLEGPR
jgi:transketolase